MPTRSRSIRQRPGEVKAKDHLALDTEDGEQQQHEDEGGLTSPRPIRKRKGHRAGNSLAASTALKSTAAGSGDEESATISPPTKRTRRQPHAVGDDGSAKDRRTSTGKRRPAKKPNTDVGDYVMSEPEDIEDRRGEEVEAAATADSMPEEETAGTGAPLTAQEEEDLSSALIAKMLAEEQANYGGFGGDYAVGYYDDYLGGGGTGGFGGDSDADGNFANESEPDDDWYPDGRPRRGRRQATTRGRARKPTTQSAERPTQDEPDGDDKGPDNAAKKQKPASEGQYNTGGYTEEEERKFLEGLENFGRGWDEISRYMVTRDPKSVRSHAQKYFIRLFRDGVPLPAKVRETGEGYTLSGRPLDPNSAAARPYLKHVMQLDPPKELKMNEEDTTAKEEETVLPEQKANKDCVDSKVGSEKNTNNDNNNKQPAVKSPSQQGRKGRQQQQQQQQQPKSPEVNNVPLTPPLPRTEYAINRPRRSQTRQRLKVDQDPHSMVKCTAFSGTPGSGVIGSQPFRMMVHTTAQLQMDFHAHLMQTEIIGLLGGTWDIEKKVLKVVKAFPCQTLATQDDHHNVEMDPESELAVRQVIEREDLRVVGWYHSHPTFLPDPSFIDIENQLSYQILFQSDEVTASQPPTASSTTVPEDSGDACASNNNNSSNISSSNSGNSGGGGGEVETDSSVSATQPAPFVGAIVGPFDPNLPRSLSVINWFYVMKNSTNLLGDPKRLCLEHIEDNELPVEEADRLLSLLDRYKDSPYRTNFKEAWKPLSTELKLTKMLVSLAYRMPWVRRAAIHSSSSKPGTSNNVQDQDAAPDSDVKGSAAASVSDPPTGDMPAISTTQADTTPEDQITEVATGKGFQDYLLTTLSQRLESW